MNDNEKLWILCYTNEEVLKIAHILKKSWYKNYKIALKWLWYPLDKTLEFYDFINGFDNVNEITKENIEKNYQLMLAKYWENKNIINLKYAIEDLLKLYKKIYKTDLYDFFNWISENDLWEKSKITISTLHQSKGKEFDSVILIFDDGYNWEKDFYSDSMRRLIYVWITRAKNNLIVIWNNRIQYFNDLRNIISTKEENTKINIENNPFIDLTTSLSDIVLSFNHNLDLNKEYYPIWTKLEYNQYWLSYNWKTLIKFSQKFKKQLDIYLNKWYKITGANIYQRIVYPLLDDNTGTRTNVVLYLAIIWLKK